MVSNHRATDKAVQPALLYQTQPHQFQRGPGYPLGRRGGCTALLLTLLTVVDPPVVLPGSMFLSLLSCTAGGSVLVSAPPAVLDPFVSF